MRSSAKRRPLLAGYMPEKAAAKKLGISEKTMTGYRKNRIGPPFITVARRIFYSPDALQAWLDAGGTRQSA